MHKQQLTLRYDPDLIERARSSATQRGMTLTAVFEEAVRTYLDRQTVASEVADFEARMSASVVNVQNEVVLVGNAVQLTMAVLDQLTQFILTTTPELHAAERESALVVGARRYSSFLSDMPNFYSKRKRRARVAEQADPQE